MSTANSRCEFVACDQVFPLLFIMTTQKSVDSRHNHDPKPLRCIITKIVWTLLWDYRAENNGRSTDNVGPDRGLDRSNSRLASHLDWSFLDMNILFSI